MQKLNANIDPEEAKSLANELKKLKVINPESVTTEKRMLIAQNIKKMLNI